MLKKTLNLVGIAMALSLVTYAISESLPGSNDKATTKTRVKRGTGPTGNYDRERDIVNKLNLTDDQYRAYAVVQETMRKGCDEMRKLKSGHMERGAELNRNMHDGLERAFGTLKYATYRRLWFTGAEASTRGHVTSFGGADERILSEIGISSDQWKAYEDLQTKVDTMDAEIQAAWGAEDHKTVYSKGAALNRFNRDGMKKLLTKPQYEKWTAEWLKFAKVTPGAVDAEKRQRDAIRQGDQGVVFGPAKLMGGGGSSSGTAAAGGG